MPFWEYVIPPEGREQFAAKLSSIAKPQTVLKIAVEGEPWTIVTTGFTRQTGERIFIELEDKKYGGFATFEFDKATGRFEITDSDFPFPLEFIILKDKLGIDVSNYKLIRQG